MSEKLIVGIYLFEEMTMLDGYAPLQMLSFVEQFETFTVAKANQPLRSDCGAMLSPDHDFNSCPPIDILVVPGGGNVLPQMIDEEVQAFLTRTANSARYVTSVCTGALILAEAGLLDGYRATTHWGWIDSLSAYSAIDVVDERVVVDRNRITGGGITAGLDFALTLIGEVVAQPVAEAMQLIFEYRPEPPFNAGSPNSVAPEILQMVNGKIAEQSRDLLQFLEAKQAT